MEYWEAYESTILVQRYHHLKACNPLTNNHTITGKPVTCGLTNYVHISFTTESRISSTILT